MIRQRMVNIKKIIRKGKKIRMPKGGREVVVVKKTRNDSEIKDD